MSAILGLFGGVAEATDDRTIERMLARMASRGADTIGVTRLGGCVLGVQRFGWESTSDFGGPASVSVHGGIAVVTDATLYYREDLMRGLPRSPVTQLGTSPAELVLSAYRAWGSRCAEHLEGDFAFLLWDSGRQRAVCSRDFAGKRPLCWAAVQDGLVVASTVGGLLEHPSVSAELNLASIAETACGMWAGSDETAFAAVRRLHAGHTLIRERGAIQSAAHWMPPQMGSAAPSSLEEAARELRHLLARATEQRLPAHGPTAVWLSGGWDSTAVYASAQKLRAGASRSEAIQAISFTFPHGDPGREDELIQMVTDHWSGKVSWVDIEDVPMLDGAAERAARREEPFAHAFETWNRALIARTKAVDARVAFDGNGGDQLFFSSNVFFADLLRQGRWRELRWEWREKGGRRFRDFWDNAIRPLFPPTLLELRKPFEGGVFERPVPEWISPRFAREHGLRRREREHSPAPPWPGLAAREAYWYLTCPHFGRAYGLLASLALGEGIEMRSPLLDRRVVDFAAARPREERNRGREVKRLLRASMKELLPAKVLAPRDTKTGTLDGYFARHMELRFPDLVRLVTSGSPRLADLGILEPRRLLAAAEQYRKSRDGRVGYALHQTVQVELWLRLSGAVANSSRTAVATPRVAPLIHA